MVTVTKKKSRKFGAAKRRKNKSLSDKGFTQKTGKEQRRAFRRQNTAGAKRAEAGFEFLSANRFTRRGRDEVLLRKRKEKEAGKLLNFEPEFGAKVTDTKAIGDKFKGIEPEAQEPTTPTQTAPAPNQTVSPEQGLIGPVQSIIPEGDDQPEFDDSFLGRLDAFVAKIPGGQLLQGLGEQERGRLEAGGVQGSAVPFAQAGTFGAILGLGKKSVTSVAKTSYTKAQEASISKISQTFNMGRDKVTKIIDKKLLTQAVDKALKTGSIKDLAKKTSKWLLGGVAGADMLFTWFALDNVISGQKFFIGDIAKSVSDGSLSPANAQKALEGSKETRDTAIAFIEISAIVNPILWPFRKLILGGVEGQTAANDLAQDNAQLAIDTASEREATGPVEAEPTFGEVQAENRQTSEIASLQQKLFDSNYFDLIREGRQEEAKQLVVDRLAILGG